jgi:hypothetical protein
LPILSAKVEALFLGVQTAEPSVMPEAQHQRIGAETRARHGFNRVQIAEFERT